MRFYPLMLRLISRSLRFLRKNNFLLLLETFSQSALSTIRRLLRFHFATEVCLEKIEKLLKSISKSKSIFKNVYKIFEMFS